MDESLTPIRSDAKAKTAGKDRPLTSELRALRSSRPLNERLGRDIYMIPEWEKQLRWPWPDAGILRMTHGALAEIERLRKVERAVKRLIDMQEELPPDFAKVLHDNLWELYESEVPNAKVSGGGAFPPSA